MTIPDSDIQRRNETNRRARAFLQDLLAEGPQSFQTIHQQAVARGISKATLMTAKRSLNVKSRKSDGHAIWNLPDAASCPPDPQPHPPGLPRPLPDSRKPVPVALVHESGKR